MNFDIAVRKHHDLFNQQLDQLLSLRKAERIKTITQQVREGLHPFHDLLPSQALALLKVQLLTLLVHRGLLRHQLGAAAGEVLELDALVLIGIKQTLQLALQTRTLALEARPLRVKVALVTLRQFLRELLCLLKRFRLLSQLPQRCPYHPIQAIRPHTPGVTACGAPHVERHVTFTRIIEVFIAPTTGLPHGLPP